MQGRTAWRILGIAHTADTSAIRRAYADSLRAMDVDADPDAYARLREARDVALRLARSAAETDDPESQDPAEDPAPPDVDTGTTVDVQLPPTALVTLGKVPPRVAAVRGSLTPADHPPPPMPPSTPNSVVIPIPHDRIAFGATRYDIGYGDPSLTIVQRVPNDAVDAAFQTLWSLLQPDDGRDADTALLPPEVDRAREAADIILSDPKLSEVGYRRSVDEWMADLLARTSPRSDPLLHGVADVFDWRARGTTVEASAALAFIADRIDASDFITAVRQPDHRFHRPWRALSAATPDSIRPRFLLSKRRVRALLKEIREKHPNVEDYLDPTEVHRWEGTMIKGPNMWLWIVMVAVLIRVLALALSTPNPQEASPSDLAAPLFDGASATAPRGAGDSEGLKDAKSDIDMALLRIEPGFDLARVRRDNPALARELEDAWSAAHASDTPLAPFLNQIADLLRTRFETALATAGYDDLHAWTSMRRTLLQGIAQRGDVARSDFLRGELDPSPFATDTYFRARDELMVKVLLNAGTIPPDRAQGEKRTFTVPADVIDTIARRTNLPRETVLEALLDKSTPRARCQAMIAFYDAVLELPRARGLRLMRDL